MLSKNSIFENNNLYLNVTAIQFKDACKNDMKAANIEPND